MNNAEHPSKAAVAYFCDVVSGANTLSLALLREIEETVTSLAWIERGAENNRIYAGQLAEALRGDGSVKTSRLDDDGTICDRLQASEEAIAAMHEELVSKRNTLRGAPELQGHQSSVVDAYTSAIAAVAGLHNQMVELRWTVGEHDADLEQPTGPTFSDPESLKAYLEAI